MFPLRAGHIGFFIGISERRRPNAGFATGPALTARVSTAASSIAMDAFRRTIASRRPAIQEMLPAGTGLMMKIGITTEKQTNGTLPGQPWLEIVCRPSWRNTFNV
jgi:hypothetical protein